MTSFLSRAGSLLWKSSLDIVGASRSNLVPKANLTWCQLRYLSSEKSREDEGAMIRLGYFSEIENKTKDNYLEMVNIYKSKERLRRGHVEFIYSALRHMKEFGVEKDLEVYKSLVDVFPKGKMIPENPIQAEFMHYPKHQQCAIDLLEQMEENAVIPDWDMEDQLLNVFGKKGYPLRRYWRMMYWMPKWKNASVFPLPRPLPSDKLLLAKLAIKRITDVDINTELSVFKTSSVEDSLDDTWIVNGQSEEQRELLTKLSENATLFVEGEFRIWLRNVPISYFVLRTESLSAKPPDEDESQDDEEIHIHGVWSNPNETCLKPKKSVHMQEDGTILAVCATGSSSKDSLLSWLRCLQQTNPRLGSIPVLFKLETSGSPPDPTSLEEPKTSLPPTQ